MMGCITITTLCILVNTVLGGNIVEELTDAGIQDSVFNTSNVLSAQEYVLINNPLQVFSIAELSINIKLHFLKSSHINSSDCFAMKSFR